MPVVVIQMEWIPFPNKHLPMGADGREIHLENVGLAFLSKRNLLGDTYIGLHPMFVQFRVGPLKSMD